MRGNLVAYTLIILLTLTAVTAAPRLADIDVGPDPIVENGYLSVEYEIRGIEHTGRVATHVWLGDEVAWWVSREADDERFTFSDAFPVPDDYAGEHEFKLRVEIPEEFPIRYSESRTVVRSRQARDVPRGTDTRNEQRRQIVPAGAEGLMIVIDPEVPNVARGEWIYWPITIQNTQDRSITANIGVEGVRDWATYRIDPQPTITVPARGTEEMFLYMSIDEDAWLGLRSFTITATHDGVVEQKEARLAVLKPAERDSFAWLPWLLILLAIALLIAGVLLTRRGGRDASEVDEDDDLITYY